MHTPSPRSRPTTANFALLIGALIAAFTMAVSRAEWINFTLRAPMIYCGDYLSLQGSLGGQGSLMYDNGDAIFTGVSADPSDPNFWAQINVGNDFASLDASALSGVSDGGSVWLNL